MEFGKKLDFLVVGVQKGGTTAVFEYLKSIKNIEIPECKEVHFFDREDIDWNSPPYDDYHNYFKSISFSKNGIFGEITPIYIYWPRAIDRIRTYNPDIKIISIFRDPVERAWSHWRMEYARGAEREPFSWCVREGRVRVGGGDQSRRTYSYVERGFYGDQVRQLLEVFPRDQVFFASSQSLRAEPEHILGAMCDFLNAPRLKAVSPKEVHVGPNIDNMPSISDKDRIYLHEIYSNDQDNFSKLTGIPKFF